VPVGRSDGRARDRAPRRDQPTRPAAVGALVLVRACAPGGRAARVARHGRERGRGAARLPPPRADGRARANGWLGARARAGSLRRMAGLARGLAALAVAIVAMAAGTVGAATAATSCGIVSAAGHKWILVATGVPCSTAKRFTARLGARTAALHAGAS